MKFLSDILAKAGLTTDGVVTLNNTANASVDTDRFVVLDNGVVKYRTGVQLLSDIGAASFAAGLPVGGTAGQILAKIDGTNYNTQWIDNFTPQVKHLVKLGENMSAGTPVYVSGSHGTNMIVSKASNDSETTSSKVMGLLQQGGVTNDQVYVITEGLLSGLDTSTATAGDPVWLGPNGTLIFGSANRPVAPLHMVYLGVVSRVQSNNGEIFVKVQNGYELDELHDVQVGSYGSKDVLWRDTATNLWKNRDIFNLIGAASASDNGYLTSTDWSTFNSKQSQLNGTGFVKVSGTTISYDNSTYLTANQAITVTATGEATGVSTSSGTAPSIALTLTNSAVIGKVLTGLNLTTGGTIASTDSILQAFGKIQNQLSAVVSGVIYQGTWNASTNTPTLTSSIGTKGYYYVVDVAGSTNLNGITDWKVGDWAIFNGSTWDKVDNTDAVSSVNGYAGAVSLVTGDILEGAGSIGGRPSQLFFTDARARAAISVSGSLSYNSSTGVISYTQPTNVSAFTNDAAYITTAGARSAISVAGSLSYNSTTGVISYTQPTNVSAFSNDSGYITTAQARAAISVAGSLSYNSTTGVISYTQPTNISAFTNDSGYITTAGARSALSFAAGSGAYNSSTGVITIPTNTNQLTNGAGFITGITSAMVTTALGYTPYNATNPNGYTSNTGTVTSVSGTGSVSGITLSGSVTTSGSLTLGGTLSLTSGQVTGALGYTPYNSTNPNGYITSSGTAAAVSQTVSGTNSAELVRGNMADNDQFRILVGGTATNSGFVEIATADDGTEPIYVRQYTGVFTSLVRTATLLDGSGNTSFPGSVSASSFSGSISSSMVTNALGYTPVQPNGTGASGTWGINITGSAGYASGAGNSDTVDGFHADAFFRNLGFEGGGANANTLPESRSAFTYAVGAPWSGPVAHFGASGYGLQLNAVYGNGSSISYRVRNGDNGTWSSWREFIHSGNYNSYSPTLTGGGASGTWGINITGTASSETLGTVTGRGASTSTFSSFSGGLTVNTSKVGFRNSGATEFIQGEAWTTGFYGYNNNNGFLFYQRDASGNARPSFHIGGYNNAAYGGYTDADAMVTLVRGDGSKAEGSTYATKGLSTSAYWTNIIKTTDRTIFRDAQSFHQFTGNIQATGATFSCGVGTGRGSYGIANANIVLLASEANGNGVCGIDFRSGGNYPSDGAQIYYQSATNGGESSRLVFRVENDTDDSIYMRAGFHAYDATTVNIGGQGYTNPVFRWLVQGGAIMSLNSGGTLTVSSDVVAYGSPSDRTLKTIKEVIPNALQSVLKLSGYRFDWNKPDEVLNIKEDIGVIAQEVAEVFPELARTNDNGYMSVRYQGLTAVLIEAIKEQQAQIEDLKNQITELKENK